jgi:hypothetical protein
MRRETIETSYFGRCCFCSEIIVAERHPPAGRECVWCSDVDVRSRPTNDNYFEVVMRVRKPTRRGPRSSRAA